MDIYADVQFSQFSRPDLDALTVESLCSAHNYFSKNSLNGGKPCFRIYFKDFMKTS